MHSMTGSRLRPFAGYAPPSPIGKASCVGGKGPRWLLGLLPLLILTMAAGRADPGGSMQVIRQEGRAWKMEAPGRLVPLATGSFIEPGQGLRTGDDGQVRLTGPGGLQLRLKEETGLWFFDQAQGCRLDRGCLGLRLPPGHASSPVRVATPHVGVEIASGITVIKVVPLLTRVAVLQGRANATHRNGWRLDLGPREEAAAAFPELSASYQTLDDLYYAWYWQDPRP